MWRTIFIRPNPIECPSDNVIVQRYKCHGTLGFMIQTKRDGKLFVADKESGGWKDCFQRSCCQNYTFIAGRCVAADKDPCTLDLCGKSIL